MMGNSARTEFTTLSCSVGYLRNATPRMAVNARTAGTWPEASLTDQHATRSPWSSPKLLDHRDRKPGNGMPLLPPESMPRAAFSTGFTRHTLAPSSVFRLRIPLNAAGMLLPDCADAAFPEAQRRNASLGGRLTTAPRCPRPLDSCSCSCEGLRRVLMRSKLWRPRVELLSGELPVFGSVARTGFE